MPKPYSKLRHALDDAGISREDIAQEFERSKVIKGSTRGYVDQRFRCEFPWTMEDVYIILDMLNVPYSEITEYFPREKIKGRTA